MAAYSAFLSPDPATGGANFEAGRISRYERYWQMYQNTAYDTLTTYLKAYPSTHRLYKRTRGLRNPMGSYADFWQANIWGGQLDSRAGDGSATPSALPITADADELRTAIAQLWQWSNWAQKRQVTTLHGCVLGDAFLEVVDAPSAGKVYLRQRWPGDVVSCDWDDFGNLKRVIFEFQASDGQGKSYTYREEIEHPAYHGESDWTIYRTYRNGQPWAYASNRFEGEAVSSWEVPYNFIPVVHIPMIDTGIGWGSVGFQQAARLIDETSAKASLINDQLGKEVAPPLVTYGITPGDMTITNDDDGVPMIQVAQPPGTASIDMLVFDMNIADALASLTADMETIKELLPELQFTRDVRSGMSGQALRTAYAPLIAKVRAVRANFDSGLTRAHMMGVAIGGIRKYGPEFVRFDLASYGAGALDHAIGDRPVLPRGTDEELDEQSKRWTMLETAVAAGVPLETALAEVMDWSPERIATMTQAMRLAFLEDGQ